MNAVLSGFERVLIGHDPDPAYETILDFRNGEVLSRRDLTESMLVVASVNKGKTSLLRTPARAMLRDGFGGLVLVVKATASTRSKTKLIRPKRRHCSRNYRIHYVRRSMTA
jgi:hypothetical protein